MSERFDQKIPELYELAEKLGDFMEYWGYKKIHGQLWCHIYLSSYPLDASELIQRLGISKALVSITLKELTQYGVIEDAGKNDKGRKTYRAINDISKPIFETLRRREQFMIARIVSAYRSLSRLSPEELRMAGIQRTKLSALGRLIKLVDLGLQALVRHRWNGIYELIQIKQKVFGSLNKPKDEKNPEHF